MSAYPITVRSTSYDHRGGTKSYHLMIVHAANGNSLFISRWGKKGAFGEVKVETFSTLSSAEKAWDKKERAKTSNGYARTGIMREEVATDAKSWRAAMGVGMWNKVGKALAHVDPTLDVSGMREVDGPGYDEDGRKLDNARKADIQEAMQAQREAERIESEKVLRDNPNFGRFG